MPLPRKEILPTETVEPYLEDGSVNPFYWLVTAISHDLIYNYETTESELYWGSFGNPADLFPYSGLVQVPNRSEIGENTRNWRYTKFENLAPAKFDDIETWNARLGGWLGTSATVGENGITLRNTANNQEVTLLRDNYDPILGIDERMLIASLCMIENWEPIQNNTNLVTGYPNAYGGVNLDAIGRQGLGKDGVTRGLCVTNHYLYRGYFNERVTTPPMTVVRYHLGDR